MSKSWPKIILFGDSHTQRSFDPNNGYWGALLADKLQRSCDVIQRGFSGYNSRFCRIILKDIFEQFNPNEIACVTILLGSNDANDPLSPTGQHVPLEEFRSNIAEMIKQLNTIGITKDKVILISPPNYFHEDFVQLCKEQNRTNIPINSDVNVAKYAEACKMIAIEHGVTFLDIYRIFSNATNNRQLFCDGLHLSRTGGQLFYDSLCPLVIEKVQSFVNKPFEQTVKFPYWNEIDFKNPDKFKI